MNDSGAVPEGWIETRSADGTVHVAMTPLTQVLMAVFFLIVGVLLGLFGCWWASVWSRPGLIAFLPFAAAAALCLQGLKTLLVREEWRIGDNFFEITHTYLVILPVRRRYLGAAIHLVRERRGGTFVRSYEWVVRVERKRRRPAVYSSLDAAEAVAVAEYLRLRTG